MSIEINANEIRNLIHVIDSAFEAGIIPKGRESETNELQGRLLDEAERTTAINAKEVSNIIHVIDYAFEAGEVIPKGREAETNELQGRLLEAERTTYENGNDRITGDDDEAVLVYDHAGRTIVKVVPIDGVREDGRVVWFEGGSYRVINPKGGTYTTRTQRTQKVWTKRDVVVKRHTPENMAAALESARLQNALLGN